MKITGFIILAVSSLIFSDVGFSADIPVSARSKKAISRVKLPLLEALSKKKLKYGAPIFIRIFKQPGILELWLENDFGKYVHFKDYDICTFSGDLGPKLKVGDLQSPEGFYYVNANRLNPWSQYHLSFNLGYPNTYDRYHGRTGSALMVHGNCVSIGCYAMTDDYIDEIYSLASAALSNGQSLFRVHSFPFVMDKENLESKKDSKWYGFWKNLKQGYDLFEKNRRPPNVEVEAGIYVFDNG